MPMIHKYRYLAAMNLYVLVTLHHVAVCLLTYTALQTNDPQYA